MGEFDSLKDRLRAAHALDKRRKAKEDNYFSKLNEDALKRLAEEKKQVPRTSPVSGEPMEKVLIDGIVVDRCPTSGGIWCDAGELEKLVSSLGRKESGEGWYRGFLRKLAVRKE